ncbi:Spy/CpxP family protein refolding chaperone [Kordia sp. YSTF-M3]|uniref:Spy/CpxP family protein refolding chaperone n=1 Tax=Kordia aestuariivivens TaxID=2759037 RepID=A0ABR7Q7L5_9FLAO|nr:Spy/CpxP family protein refolding chaperone [Kordia aestuariivivens]MBC8754522.1 Spy/CpxP family protein refolding chaperone [Kordia aestuariivivens]
MFKIFGDKHPPDRNPGQFIAKELNFDEAQMNDFRNMNRAHHEAMREISREIKELKDALFNELSETGVNETEVNDIARRIGEKERQKDLKTFYHFKEVQKICNDEQRLRFNSIIQDALHRHGKKKRK